MQTYLGAIMQMEDVTARQKQTFSRWVNMRAIFHKIKTFEEYDKSKAKE